MNISHQNIVYVFYHRASKKQALGRLLLKDRKIYFEYDSDFLKTDLQLSPFKLPLKTGIMTSKSRIFDGLFGLFNDSLPDGWGRLLLDRKMMNKEINPEALSPLDRLCFVGKNGMGALSYEPENPHSHTYALDDLDEIEIEIQSTYNEDNTYLDKLITLSGSSAGARPKVMMRFNNEEWLIKFRSSQDPKDISTIEFAYHLMAKDAGLIVPEAKLFPSKKGIGYFGVKRFDRQGDERIHMHTIAGLLHADHREPTLDYESIMKATLYLTKDVRQSEIQFRNAVFNVLSYNRDDHSKNFSFIMNAHGEWSVSPAYDLTFSSGPGGEHCSMIMGEGKNPSMEHVLKLAHVGSIKKEKAMEIIEQVWTATSRWEKFANDAGVSKSQTKTIEKSLELVRNHFGMSDFGVKL